MRIVLPGPRTLREYAKHESALDIWHRWTKGAGSLEKSHLLSHYTVAAEGLGITKSVCELSPIVPAYYCLVRQDNMYCARHTAN